MHLLLFSSALLYFAFIYMNLLKNIFTFYRLLLIFLQAMLPFLFHMCQM
jgi:hypothetical protein